MFFVSSWIEYKMCHYCLKRVFVILGFCTMVSFSLKAQTLGQALEYVNNNNFEKALVILDKLARNNDPLAQYNLGLMHLKGQVKNTDTAVAYYWLSLAARQGLVEAYVLLKEKAVLPAVGVRIKSKQTPQDWVRTQNPDFYTLQLASSTNQKLIEKYYLENNLQGKAGYYKNRRQGEDWYALIYGSYATVNEANAASEKLPPEMKKWSPWVRKIKAIHRIMID